MTVKASEAHKLFTADPSRIMAFLVDLYGRKIADEVARKVVSDEPTPTVAYPQF